MKKIWVSDLIGEDYKKWSNENVIFDCGTGSGKTTFCLEILAQYAAALERNILYLCNRTELKEHVQSEAQKKNAENVRIITYQQLQEMLLRTEEIGKYEYILCDEAHYFTTDAVFNDYTDLSYNYIRKQVESVVIYMSATAKEMFEVMLMKNEVKPQNVYRIVNDYSYVEQLVFYKKKQLTSIINRILEEEEDSKIVVFCNSSNRIQEMFGLYGDKANYYCSRHSKDKELKKICSEDFFIRDAAAGTMTFPKRLLFTTSALDNGVNLQDRAIKYMVSELFSIDQMVQALGRKRSIDENDRCKFFIREYSKQEVQLLLNNNNRVLKPVRMYLNNPIDFYLIYGGDRGRTVLKDNPIMYTDFFLDEENLFKNEVKVNRMRYNKFSQDNAMLERMKEIGYKSVVLDLLGDRLKEAAVDTDAPALEIKKKILLTYLNKIEGKKLFAADREELKKKMELIGLKTRSLGIATVNGVLEDLFNGMYGKRFANRDTVTGRYFSDNRRVLEDGSQNPNRNQKYWMLQ